MRAIPIRVIAAIFCFVTLSVPPSSACADAPQKRHLYLEWRYNDQIFILGHISGKRFQRVADRKIPLVKLTQSEVATWLGPADNSAALLYFHCMWGQEKHFERQCLRSFEKALVNQPDTGIQTVISIIWHAGGARYAHNWNRAAAKGEALGPILDLIGNHYPGRLHGLAHSMGNRFLEGALRNRSDSTAIIFQSLVLFSPDLDAAAADADLARLFRSTKRLILFIHRHDRVLLLSRWMLNRRRLGRVGLEGTMTKPLAEKLTVIDMTGRIHGIQNHAHLRKKWARQLLAEVWQN